MKDYSLPIGDGWNKRQSTFYNPATLSSVTWEFHYNTKTGETKNRERVDVSEYRPVRI